MEMPQYFLTGTRIFAHCFQIERMLCQVNNHISLIRRALWWYIDDIVLIRIDWALYCSKVLFHFLFINLCLRLAIQNMNKSADIAMVKTKFKYWFLPITYSLLRLQVYCQLKMMLNNFSAGCDTDFHLKVTSDLMVDEMDSEMDHEGISEPYIKHLTTTKSSKVYDKWYYRYMQYVNARHLVETDVTTFMNWIQHFNEIIFIFACKYGQFCLLIYSSMIVNDSFHSLILNTNKREWKNFHSR